jgi:hypothetical protein
MESVELVEDTKNACRIVVGKISLKVVRFKSKRW